VRIAATYCYYLMLRQGSSSIREAVPLQLQLQLLALLLARHPHLCAAVALACDACHVWEVRAPLPAVQPVLPPVAHLHALATAAAEQQQWRQTSKQIIGIAVVRGCLTLRAGAVPEHNQLCLTLACDSWLYLSACAAPCDTHQIQY
jgi:hypothetical protein